MSFGRKGIKGAKGRQSGRACAKRYLNEKRWVRNKLRKLGRHVRRFTNDKQAAGALARLKEAG